MAEAAAGRNSDPAPDARGRPPAGGDDAPADDRFAELRSLIVGPERRELRALQAQLHDPSVQTRDVSRVLPDAIALRATDPKLTRALAPSIEEALTASVQKDPRPLADALFPVMGPAIRKAVAHAFASMLDSLNRTVEHSLSWRSLRWRWTALTTGKPFAEIVLLNTLQYRVEQVFLIHAASGLLLQHLASDARAGDHADQISAMLTAIRDFARDSFRTADGDSLDALRVGELSVIVEQGPYAILAGVVRGTPPAALRTLFQDTIETVHRRFGAELQSFDGDASTLDRARPILEACLVTEFREAKRSAPYRGWLIALGLVLLALATWAFAGLRERQRFDAYVDQLRAEPGIVIMSSGRRGGRFFVAGLRDPLARAPASLLASSQLTPDDVDAHWEPYQALQPQFVTTRARDLLRPPPGVTLKYSDGVLTADGSAPQRWVAESERIAPAITGVRRFEYTGIPPAVRLSEQLEALTVRFAKGQARIAPEQADSIRAAGDLLRELDEAVAHRGQRARVEILGHADADGTEIANEPLSQARADGVLHFLRTQRLDAVDLTARGLGTTAPLTRGTTEPDKQRNRRVSFRVLLPDRPAAGSPQ
jgi:OOP family OmpA-OmpF porin